MSADHCPQVLIHTSVRCAFSTREDSEAGASGGGRRGRSVFGGVGGAVSGIAALPGRLLRRGGRCTTAAGSAAGDGTAHPAPLTELVLAEKRAADAAAAAGSPGADVATPARPAAWEARLRVSVASRWKQNLQFSSCKRRAPPLRARARGAVVTMQGAGGLIRKRTLIS